MTATATRYITFEEFMADESLGHHVEWVDGKVVPMAPPSTDQARTSEWLKTIIRTYLEMRELGEVFGDPAGMKLPGDGPLRQPDAFVVLKRNADRVQRRAVFGPADLVIEVVSPDSRRIDRGDKFEEYERGGVREYWIVDPERKQAEFNQLDEQGRYQVVRPDAEGVYHSREVEGLWLKEEWLWQRPLPTLLGVLKAWKLV